MKIVTQILYTEDWKPIADIVIPNMIEYSKKHGYSYSPMLVPNGYDNFDKIHTMYDTFNLYDIDFIFNRDMDTLITNLTIPLESFIEDGKDLFICKDFNGINSGTFLVRKSEWSQKFLDYIMSKKGTEGIYGEQDAIVAYMNEFPNDEKIKILPHPSINSYLYENYPEIPMQTHEQGQWERGNFLLHLPGLGMNLRETILQKTLDKIIYE